MSKPIDSFRLKIRNTQKLKRTHIPFTLDEAIALDRQIVELEKELERLRLEVLEERTLTIDIVGSEF